MYFCFLGVVDCVDFVFLGVFFYIFVECEWICFFSFFYKYREVGVYGCVYDILRVWRGVG